MSHENEPGAGSDAPTAGTSDDQRESVPAVPGASPAVLEACRVVMALGDFVGTLVFDGRPMVIEPLRGLSLNSEFEIRGGWDFPGTAASLMEYLAPMRMEIQGPLLELPPGALRACKGGPRCKTCKTFRCTRCKKRRPWCIGAGDEHPTWCDLCFWKRHERSTRRCWRCCPAGE